MRRMVLVQLSGLVEFGPPAFMWTVASLKKFGRPFMNRYTHGLLLEGTHEAIEVCLGSVIT